MEWIIGLGVLAIAGVVGAALWWRRGRSTPVDAEIELQPADEGADASVGMLLEDVVAELDPAFDEMFAGGEVEPPSAERSRTEHPPELVADWRQRLIESQRLVRKKDDQLRALRARIHQLEAQVETQRGSLHDLQQALDQARGMAAAPVAAIEPLEPQDAEPAAGSAAPAATRPSSPDDLSRIRGIGPATAVRLNQVGVWSFAQISVWSADDLLQVATQTGLSPRRIEREAWIDQARELCTGQPAESAADG